MVRSGEAVKIKVEAFNPAEPARASLHGFVEADGYVSIEAEHYTRRTNSDSAQWEKIDDYGRTLSGMSVFPVTAASVSAARFRSVPGISSVFVQPRES